MDVKDLTIGIAGSGGDGCVTAGEILIKAAARAGMHGLLLKSFGPQIRGGEACAHVRLGAEPVGHQGDRLDILVVFSWADYRKFEDELALKPGAVIVHDEALAQQTAPMPEFDPQLELQAAHAPFTQLAMDAAGAGQAKNMAMLGVLAGMFQLLGESLRETILKQFARKGDQVAQANAAAFDAGLAYGEPLYSPERFPQLRPAGAHPKRVMTGNDAAALGALSAGCRFFAGYPITPSTEIMERLAKWLPQFGGKMVQTEDEIAAINMVIGASYAGEKAMTATSGPGLSLMQEALGLAAMAEVPCVVVDVQRVGPSTGIPTKSEQSDLSAAVHGGHGDAPRAVLAPTDVRDCFMVTRKAFEIAEKYQMPVLVLSDQFIGHRSETVDPEGLDLPPVADRLKPSAEALNEYQRFAIPDDDPVSPMADPGTEGGAYLAGGIEHDESGRPTSVFRVHEAMNEKRYKKMQKIAREYGAVHRFGPKDADIGVIGWGSSKGAIEEAVRRFGYLGIKAAGVVPELLHPLPAETIADLLKPFRHVFVVELSHEGQFYRHLKSELPRADNWVRYSRGGARALTAEEIEQLVCQTLEPECAKKNR